MKRHDTISCVVPPGRGVWPPNLRTCVLSLRRRTTELSIIESALSSNRMLRIVGVAIYSALRKVRAKEEMVALQRRTLRNLASRKKSLREMQMYLEDAAPQAVSLVSDALGRLNTQEETTAKQLAIWEGELAESRLTLEKYRAMYEATQNARKGLRPLSDDDLRLRAELREQLIGRAALLKRRIGESCSQLYNMLATVADTVTSNREESNFVTAVLAKAAVLFEHTVTNHPTKL